MLAAGAGTRLAPLTRLRPKALCPVGGVPLVDRAIERAASVAADVWVNVHHGRAQLEAHLEGRRLPSGAAVGISVEEPEALGTAGALGELRDALDGRPVVVLNADGWTPEPPTALVEGWDGERVRVLVPGGGAFGPTSAVAGCLLPWRWVAGLSAEPSGLYEVCWAPAHAAGELEVVAADGPFVDCGTPAQYLAANLLASGGATVVGEGARVLGRTARCVLWEGVTVHRGEVLVDAIRADDRTTVYVR